MKRIGKVVVWDKQDRLAALQTPNGKVYSFNFKTFPEYMQREHVIGREVYFETNKETNYINSAYNVSFIPTSRK